MNCYLSRNYKGTDSAGNKAKTDIEHIMQEMNFKNVGLRQTTYNHSLLSFLLTLAGVLKAPFCLQRGDLLFLQYPLKKYYAFVCNMAHLRGVKVVTLIHDLGSFRRKKLTIAQEIKRLNHSDYIIAHNEKMEKWLKDNGCKAKLGVLGIFDFLSETSAALPRQSAKRPYSVLYAGALSPRKNAFLYEWDEILFHSSNPSYRVMLYGNGFDADKIKSRFFEYIGFVKSDQLITTAQGDFGLVWDGFSVNSCTGNFGEYLQYNNPHKTSLYLRCGMPVIIWSRAALASFIKNEGIGLCINSLDELEGKLLSLTTEQYTTMCQNVQRISERLAHGAFYKAATLCAIKEISEQ